MTDLKSTLKEVVPQINSKLEKVLEQEISEIPSHFNNSTKPSIEAIADVVLRGGKRIRAVLGMKAYELAGGSNTDDALKLAAAIELLQSYLLEIDDVTDKAQLRRNGPTAHEQMRQYFVDRKWQGDEVHFGNGVGITSAITLQHIANKLILSMDITPDLKVKVMSNLHVSMVKTGMGQFHDIFARYLDDLNEEQVVAISQYKTSYYTAANPIYMGAAAGGASDQELDGLERFAIPLGTAFQIRDDILGVMGDEEEFGKSTTSDLAEGKRTLIMQRALDTASDSQIGVLESALGNEDLTPEQVNEVHNILKDTGAYTYAVDFSQKLIDDSLNVLHTELSQYNGTSAYSFFESVVQYIIDRNK